MANIYVRSTDGSNADNGSTWALAKADLTGAAAIDGPGDTIWLSDAHSESTASALTITLAGTIANPVKVICGDDVVPTPTTLTTTAIVATTGAADINISGHAYFYGITFQPGSAANAGRMTMATGNADRQRYESCVFQLTNSSASSRIYPTSSSPNFGHSTEWKNCTVQFGAATQRISPGSGYFWWDGGGILAGGTDVATLFNTTQATTGISRINNVDLSGLSTTADLCEAGNGFLITFTNCKLPASWSGGLLTGTKNATCRAEMYNCDSGDTNYVVWIEDGYGTIRDFTTLYLSGTDGIKLNSAAVPLSYKMSGNANTGYPLGTFEGMWMTLVNETTTSQTATLEIIHNESANLTENDIWLAVDYPATPGSTQFTRLSDASTLLDASPPPQASSTADWDDGLTARANSTAYSVGNLIKLASNAGRAFICTGAGTSSGSEPAGYASAVDGGSVTDGTATFKAMRRQKLAVTFTAAEQGVIRMRPVLAKASAVVWVASKISAA